MLFNFDPSATPEEIRASALQFVRKLSGFTSPSQANEAMFARAVDKMAGVAYRLLDLLMAREFPRDREGMVARARELAIKRFAQAG